MFIASGDEKHVDVSFTSMSGLRKSLQTFLALAMWSFQGGIGLGKAFRGAVNDVVRARETQRIREVDLGMLTVELVIAIQVETSHCQ